MKIHFGIFKRLTLVYSIAIMAIYLIMATLFLNNIFKSGHELVNSKEIQTQAYIKSFDAQVESIYKQQINLVNDISVSKLAYGTYGDNYEKTELILYIENTLQNIKASNSWIKDVILTIPSQTMIISAKSGYDKKIYQRDSSTTDSINNPLVESNGELQLNIGYPLTYAISEDYVPDYTIQVVLSTPALIDSLNGLLDYKESNASLIIQTPKPLAIGEQNESIALRWFQDQTTEKLNADEKLKIDGNTYEFISATSSNYQVTLVTTINQHSINQTIWQYLAILTLLTLVISVLFIMVILYANTMINKPLKEMMSAFEQLQDGKFDVQIYHKQNDEFQYLYHAFNHTVVTIQDLIKNIYEQKGLLQNAELAQLQSQINPHFLYNSFFIINRMAKTESYEQITQFVTLLAKYYRFINKETKDFIPFVNEVDHMKSYIDIQQMRFSDVISVQIENVPDSMQSVHVPKLILQPLIENAYNYGLENRLNNGILKVSYLYEKPYIDIVIEDNGEEVTDELITRLTKRLEEDDDDGKNHALVNIHRRVQLAYGSHCGLHISRSDLGGLKIVIRINEALNIHI